MIRDRANPGAAQTIERQEPVATKTKSKPKHKAKKPAAKSAARAAAPAKKPSSKYAKFIDTSWRTRGPKPPPKPRSIPLPKKVAPPLQPKAATPANPRQGRQEFCAAP